MSKSRAIDCQEKNGKGPLLKYLHPCACTIVMHSYLNLTDFTVDPIVVVIEQQASPDYSITVPLSYKRCVEHLNISTTFDDIKKRTKLEPSFCFNDSNDAFPKFIDAFLKPQERHSSDKLNKMAYNISKVRTIVHCCLFFYYLIYY